jgi:hypothetical protein
MCVSSQGQGEASSAPVSLTGINFLPPRSGLSRSTQPCARMNVPNPTPIAPAAHAEERVKPRHRVAQSLERLLKIVERNTERNGSGFGGNESRPLRHTP